MRTITAILAAHVRKAETERTRAKPPKSWQAYDCYLQAAEAVNSFKSSYSVRDVHEAQRLLKRSLAIDATYARSYAALANLRTVEWWFEPDFQFLRGSAGLRTFREIGGVLGSLGLRLIPERAVEIPGAVEVQRLVAGVETQKPR